MTFKDSRIIVCSWDLITFCVDLRTRKDSEQVRGGGGRPAWHLRPHQGAVSSLKRRALAEWKLPAFRGGTGEHWGQGKGTPGFRVRKTKGPPTRA